MSEQKQVTVQDVMNQCQADLFTLQQNLMGIIQKYQEVISFQSKLILELQEKVNKTMDDGK